MRVKEKMTSRAIQILFILAAVFLIIDGVTSILVFWDQPMLFQAARAVRIAIGICLLIFQHRYIRRGGPRG